MAANSWWPFTALFKSKQVKSKRATPAKAKPQSIRSNQYHAVSVVPGTDACAAAHRFTGRRFLSQQAPRLPLPTCDAERCDCRFRHHKDRRAGPRRRSDIGLMPAAWNGAERRRTGGRRADD